MKPVTWEGKVKPAQKGMLSAGLPHVFGLEFELEVTLRAHWCIKAWLCLPFLGIFRKKRDPFSRANSSIVKHQRSPTTN